MKRGKPGQPTYAQQQRNAARNTRRRRETDLIRPHPNDGHTPPPDPRSHKRPQP